MLLAALGLVGVMAAPAAADGDVPWTVTTASNEFGSGRQNYSYTLNPGGQLKDGLVVVNHGTTPLDLAVYAADGFTTEGGQLDLVTKDAKSAGVGAWVHAGRDHVTVRPGESVEVPFTVTLPDNAAPGDYMGGIVTSLTQATDANGSQVDRRLGIRIRLRVGGELTSSLSVEDLHVRYSGTPNPFRKGDATVTYTIHNTGNSHPHRSASGVHIRPLRPLERRRGADRQPAPAAPGRNLEGLRAGTGSGSRAETDGDRHPRTAAHRRVGLDRSSRRRRDHDARMVHPLGAAAAFLAVLCGLVVAGRAFQRRRRQANLREDARLQEAVEQTPRDRETSDR